MAELEDAIDSISDDPCADCGFPLGKNWTVRYNDATGRQERVHDAGEHDREPQPGDGPEYHADHAAWERRQGKS